VVDLLGEAIIFLDADWHAVCLAFSRELPRQTMFVVVSMGKFTAVQTEYPAKYNFARDSGSITALIVVGTPGTMTYLRRKSFINVPDIKVFVLDKA
jgi:ATP-dependent RNA helicase DDX19/DBP5